MLITTLTEAGKLTGDCVDVEDYWKNLELLPQKIDFQTKKTPPDDNLYFTDHTNTWTRKFDIKVQHFKP